MANVTLTSEVESLASHDVYCVLTLTDSSSSSHTIFMSDTLGNISYEFDIPNDEVNTTAVGFRGGSTDVSLENYIDASNTLMGLIESSYTYDEDQFWSFVLYYKEKSDTTYTPIYFRFDRNDIDFDPKTQYIKLALRPSQLKDEDQRNMTSYFGAYGDLGTGEVDEYSMTYLATGTASAEHAGDFIINALWHIYVEEGAFPSSSDVEFYSDNFTNYSYNGGINGTQEFFVVGTTAVKIGKVLGILASLEGALYGSALGKVFYVHRGATDVGLKVTVDWDDVDKFKENRFYQPDFSYCQVDWDDQSATSEKTTQRNGTFIYIDFDRNYIYHCDTIDDTANTCSEKANVSDIVDTGAANYAKCFGFDKNNRLKVTINGFNSIYPYSVINFGTNAPSAYQSKDFRINKVDYDFIKNQVTLDLYEI